jgi:hypothetical protein
MPIPIPAESYPLLMDLVNQTYLDRVEQITAAQVNDDDSITFVGLDNPKKIAGKITDNDISMKLMTTGQKPQFAAPKKKPKNCSSPTSISCGLACLPAKTKAGKDTVCRKSLSPNQKAQKKSIVDTAKKQAKGKSGAEKKAKSEAPATPSGKEPINSYEHFQNEVIKAIDKVNPDLAEIYKVRAEIGDRVSRENFNKWLLEAQSRDIVQLQGGSVASGNEQHLKDSISTELSGYRTNVKIVDRPKKELDYDKTIKSQEKKEPAKPIKSYEDFQKAVGKKIDQFREEFKEGLLPIADVRSALGDAVSKKDFDKNLLRLFQDDKIRLGHDASAGKDADGITPELGSRKHYIRVD